MQLTACKDASNKLALACGLAWKVSVPGMWVSDLGLGMRSLEFGF